MDTDDIIDKALLENDSAKELGESLVWSIVDYYEEQGEDYDDTWFDGWKLCSDIEEVCDACQVDVDKVRENIIDRFLEDGWDLSECSDKIMDRLMEDCLEIAQDNYHVVDTEDCEYLVKKR